LLQFSAKLSTAPYIGLLSFYRTCCRSLCQSACRQEEEEDCGLRAGDEHVDMFEKSMNAIGWGS
jgi:hypothetical protein